MIRTPASEEMTFLGARIRLLFGLQMFEQDITVIRLVRSRAESRQPNETGFSLAAFSSSIALKSSALGHQPPHVFGVFRGLPSWPPHHEAFLTLTCPLADPNQNRPDRAVV